MGAPTFTIIRTADTDLSRVQDNIARALNPVLTAVANTPILGAPAPPKVTAQLVAVSGWFVNGIGFGAPSYQRDALGYVHLSGMATNTPGCGANVVAFVLPIGLRPRAMLAFAVEGTSHTFQAIHIDPGGNVYPAIAVAAGGFVPFDGITFLAEQ
jgi:hypothetical protein